jgi:signal transduction histidine kinase
MRRVVGWALTALVVACLVASFVLDRRSDVGVRSSSTDVLVFLPGLVATTLVGLVLTLRRPRNAVGWLLLGNGAVLALSALSDSYALYMFGRGRSDGLPGVAILWFTHGWPVIFAGIVAVALVFPDGRLPAGRVWRWVAGAGAGAFLLTIVAGMLSQDPPDPPFASVSPAAVLPDGVDTALQSVGLLGMLATFVLAGVALVLRFRKASGVPRLQMKWVALSGMLIPVAIVLATIDGRTRESGSGLLTAVPTGLALTAIPVAIGVAVLRYRLYDVDRVISGTVLYAVLTALLGTAFVGIVLAGGVALGGGSPVPTAAATAAVVLAFRPLRAHLQGRVDRLFDRSRYDARQVVDEFLADLRAGRAEPEKVGAVIAAAIGDPDLRVFFRFPEQDLHTDAAGRVVDLPEDGVRTPVMRGDDHLATVVHAPGHPEQEQVRSEVIVRCGLPIEVARLRVQVRQQLAEVEDSRARLVSAAEEERARLERDLHDGAQQRLVSIGLDLRHLQRGVDGPVRRGLDDAVAGLAAAIRELRDLAHGIRPGALDEGLPSALAQLAARSSIRTHMDVTGERFPRDVEAAAYFVVSEALANAVKHSGASRVTVAAARADGSLRVVVADDGSGGASEHGSGLTGLADRVAAVGGRLAIDSPRGRGTRVEVTIPCA